MRTQPIPLELRSRPFTSAEAQAAGVGRGVLEGPKVRRLHTGIYVARDLEVNVVIRIEAAFLVLPPLALATGLTALWLYGVDISDPQTLRFVVPRSHQVRRPGMVVSRVQCLPPSRGRAVSPEHAFVTAATDLNLVELVSAGDRLLRLRRCTLDSLREYAHSYRGPGAALARRAASLVRERVDSFRETRLRLCLFLADLPEPQCNVVIKTDDHPIGRVDLLLEAFKVIVEYEGDQHRTDKGQWSVDIHRGEEFSALGYRTVRVTAAHLRRPRSVVWRVHDAIRTGGYACLQPTFGLEWRSLFERKVR